MARLLSLALLLWAAPSHAGNPSPETLTKAHEVYQAGATAYRDGFYADAERAFRDVYELIGTPEVLYNIAVALEKQRKWGPAASVLQAYLRDSKREKDPRAIAARIVELHQRQQEQDEQDAIERRKPPSESPQPVPNEATHRQQMAALGLRGVDWEASPPPRSMAVSLLPSAAPPPPTEVVPLYRRWWLWVAIGGMVAAATTVAVALSVSASRTAPNHPFPDFGPGAK